MSAAPKLLVVDDERVVCESCSRIFREEGFEVDTINDSTEGLTKASADDYAAILLDIMLPGMDGLEFLERLRQRNQSVPVIIITGYSSIPSASAAMRLGASDYIPKPFSPDEILQAVRRLVPASTTAAPQVAAPTTGASPWTPLNDELRFGDEAWLQQGRGGDVRIGTLLSRADVEATQRVQLPSPGEIVYRGLPLAALVTATGQRVIASPVTGEVLEVNRALADRPALALEDPCNAGWIARLRPTQLASDLETCQVRTVVLAAADELKGRKERQQLARLGCKIFTARDADETVAQVKATRATLLLLEAGSFGEAGPEVVRRARETSPSLKVVVLADAQSRWETGYRSGGIFYYAVEPFADHEIIDILQVAFLPALNAPVVGRPPVGLPKWVRKICLINGRGERVSILASRGVMVENSGVGRQLIRGIQACSHPLQVTLGYGTITPLDVAREADSASRLLILTTDDTGRLPGSLLRIENSDLARAASSSKKVVVFSVQPGTSEGGTLGLDMRTTEGLVRHLLREML
jgi:DNA-binding response OmpR family regulator